MGISQSKLEGQWPGFRDNPIKSSQTSTEWIESTTQIDEKQPRMLSKILASFLSRPQEFLLKNVRQRRAFGNEGQLKVADDLIDELRVFDEGDDAPLASR